MKHRGPGGRGVEEETATALPPPLPPPPAPPPTAPFRRIHPLQVRHTEDEWRGMLSPARYAVLRQASTEPRYSSPLVDVSDGRGGGWAGGARGGGWAGGRC